MPMLQMSSEEALNKIHDMLGSMMAMYAQQDKDRSEGKSDDNVSKLINGLIDNADNKAAAAAGQQLESLAKGIQEISKIDKTELNEIAASINTINGVLNKLNVPDNVAESISRLIAAIKKLGEVDADVSKNLNSFLNQLNINNPAQLKQSMDVILNTVQSLAIINNLDMSKFSNNIKNLDSAAAKQLTDFLNIVGDGIKTELGSKEGIESALGVMKALSVFMSIDMGKLVKNIENLDDDIAMRLTEFMNQIQAGLSTSAGTEELLKATQNVMTSLSMLAKVDMKKVVRNIKRLDPDLAENIVKFVNTLIKQFEKIDKNKVQRSLEPISNLFNAISMIISTNVLKMKLSLNPIRGWLLGRQIGQFIKAIQNHIQSDKAIPEGLEYIGKILQPLVDLANPKNKFSVFKLMRVLSNKNAKRIAGFFKTLISEIGATDKNTAEAIKALSELIKVIDKFEYFASIRFAMITRMLNLKAAQRFNNFISKIMEGDWNYKRVEAMNKFIIGLVLSFSGAFAILAGTIALAGPLSAAAAFGVMYYGMQTIKNTIKDLINGQNGISGQNMEQAIAMLKQMSTSVAIMSGLIGGIAVLSSLVGMTSVVFGLGILHLTLMSITKFIKTLNELDIKKQTVNALNAVKSMKDLILALTGSVIALTLLSKFTSLADIAIAVGVITALLAVSNFMVIALTKWAGEKELEQATIAIKSISKMIGMITLSVIALTALIELTSSDKVWEAVKIVSVITLITGVLVIGLTHLVGEKELKAANNTIQALTVMLIGVTAAIGIMTLIVKNNDEKTIWTALIIVGGILLALTLMTILLGTTLSEKELKSANTTLAVLTGVLLAVSLIAKELLIPIGRRGGNAIMGAIITTAIVAALVGLTKCVTTFKDTELKNALKTMGVITGVLLAVSLIAKELLIPIGKFGKDALIGAVITLGVVGGLIGIVKLLSSRYFNVKDLTESYKALGVLTGVLLVVSLTTKFLLVPIGEQFKDAMLGVIAAGAIVTGLVALVKWMTTFKENKLHEAYKSMGVLAAALLVVSLTIKYILTPIGEQAKEALFGSAIAMAVVSGLVALVKWMTTFKENKLHESYKALGILTAELLVISLTIKYILTPIGEQAKEALFGSAVAMGVITGMLGLVKWMMTFEENKLHESYKALGILTAELLVISMTIKYVLSPIGEQAKEALFGSAIAMAVVSGMIGLVKWMMSFDETKLYESYKALGILTAELLVLSLTIKYVLSPIGEQAKEALFGSAIAMAVVVGMVGIVKWMMSFDEKKLYESYKALGILTAELLVISLTIKEVLSPIGNNAKEAFIGTAIAMGVVIGLVGIVRLLMMFDEGEMKTSYIALTVLTAELLIVSLTLKELVIPIGKQAKEALFGTAVVLGIIMGLIGMTWLLTKIEQKDLVWSLAALGVLTVIVGLVALTTKYLLIPIGKEAKEALYGAGIALGIVAIMTGIVYVLGKAISAGGKELALGMAKGAAVMLASIGLIYLLGKGITPLIEASKLVGENPKKIAIGGAIIMGALTVITGAMLGIGALLEASGGTLALAIAGGGAVLWGAAKILEILGKTLLTFTDVIDKVKHYDIKTLTQSAKSVGIILGLMGEAIIGVVALAGPALLAAAAVKPVQWITEWLLKTLTEVSEKIIDFNKKINAEDIKKFSLRVYNPDKEDDPNTLIGSIRSMVNGFNSLKGTDVIFSAIAAKVIRPVINTISKYIDVVLKVATGHYVIGYDDNGKPIYERIPDGAFLIAALSVNKGFSDFLTELNKGFNNLDGDVKRFGWLYAKTLTPVIGMVGKFVDIVLKVATSNYIVGYDDNGKPEYKHLTAQEFGAAGTAVSDQFGHFLVKLNEGFEKLSSKAISAMKKVEWTLYPIIKHVGKFVDIVLKVATANYITGYDSNGKPEYTHLTDQDFSKAGTAVSTQFTIFIMTLGTAFDGLTDKAINAMKSVRKAMGPIMDTLSKFVDSVIKVASGSYVSGYDKNGKPEYTHIEIEDFIEAGTTVSYTFGEFIRSLNDSFSLLSKDTQNAIKTVGKALKPIMEGVANFIDSVLKFATGQYVSGFGPDKNGNYTVPILKKLTNEELVDAGKKVGEMFGYFVTSITNSFDKGGNFWGSKTEDALEAISGSIGPVMESLGTFVDAIMKVATGTYIDGYVKDSRGRYLRDKDGKLIGNIKHLQPIDFTNAAIQVAAMFVVFIDKLISEFSNSQFKEKAENLQDIINESIKPIMDSVKAFSDALKPFLNIKQTTTDAKGNKKDEYLAFKPGAIKQVANDIANGFASFINIIYRDVFSEEQQKNYKAIKKNAKNVSEVLDIIKKAAGSLSKIIKQFTTTGDKENVIQKSIEAAKGFNSVMNIIVDYYNDPAHDFEGAIEPAKSCLLLMKVFNDVSSKYKEIINRIASIDSKDVNMTELTKIFNGNMLSMANNIVNVFNAIQGVEFSKLYELISSYALLSLKYVELSRLLNEEPLLQNGFSGLTANIRKLADEELRENIVQTTVSIIKYTSNIARFTTQIEKTTQTINVYTTSLERAKKALAALDDQIINKAKQREAALTNLANKINNIATAVDNLRNAFDALDENAIISRFDGLRELLEFAGVLKPSEQGKDANKNKQQSQTRSQAASANRPTQNTGNTYNYGFNGARTGHVTFQFANTILDGTFRST